MCASARQVKVVTNYGMSAMRFSLHELLVFTAWLAYCAGVTSAGMRIDPPAAVAFFVIAALLVGGSIGLYVSSDFRGFMAGSTFAVLGPAIAGLFAFDHLRLPESLEGFHPVVLGFAFTFAGGVFGGICTRLVAWRKQLSNRSTHNKTAKQLRSGFGRC